MNIGTDLECSHLNNSEHVHRVCILEMNFFLVRVHEYCQYKENRGCQETLFQWFPTCGQVAHDCVVDLILNVSN